MPRKKLSRRFEPRYGVSAAMIEEEAAWLGREVQDHEVLAVADVEEKRSERQTLCGHSWKHLRLLMDDLRNIYGIVLERFRSGGERYSITCCGRTFSTSWICTPARSIPSISARPGFVASDRSKPNLSRSTPMRLLNGCLIFNPKEIVMPKAASERKAPAPRPPSEKERPVHTIRHGKLKASIWRNVTDKGPIYNVTIVRGFRQNEQWKDSHSFGYNDLPIVAKLLNDCHSYITNLRAGERPAKAASGKSSPSGTPKDDRDIPY